MNVVNEDHLSRAVFVFVPLSDIFDVTEECGPQKWKLIV